MKQILLILIALLGIQFSSFAQCVRSGTFVPDSPNTMTYPIEGTANITMETDGSMSVNFEGDFKSVQGFLLQVFLSKTQKVNSNDPNPGTFIRVDEIGDLRCDEHNSTERDHNGEAMTGAKSFTQNLSGVAIDQYNYIILQCVEFNVPWGYAELGPVSGSDCAILGVANEQLDAVQITQNPVNDRVTILNKEQKPLEILVFDTAGNLVAAKEGTDMHHVIDVTGFSKGIYIVEMSSGSKRKTEQVVIQ